jgi:hypothetical protein
MWTTKIEHAKWHMELLQEELNKFLDTHPYKIATKRDSKTKRLIYYLKDVNEVPERISLLAGDVIQNLRSALDQLAYQLFRLNAGSRVSATHVYFPIADNLNGYEKKKIRDTKGMKQKSVDLIDVIKPYKGGNDKIWQIHKLNIIDKHRLLVTVGSSFQSFDIGALMHEKMKEVVPEFNIQPLQVFIKPADNLFPLKKGDELFIDEPNAQEKPNMQFRFNVVLHEPGIIEGELIMDALQSMFNTVEKLIPVFEKQKA